MFNMFNMQTHNNNSISNFFLKKQLNGILKTDFRVTSEKSLLKQFASMVELCADILISSSTIAFNFAFYLETGVSFILR